MDDKKAVLYTSRNAHNQYTIEHLSKVQYNIFGLGKQLSILLSGALCLVLAVTLNLSETGKFILMFVGGWMIVSSRLPETRQRTKLLEQMSGKYPQTSYAFTEEFFFVEIAGEQKKYSYEKLVSLSKDDEYEYLFISPFSAYMFPKKNLRPNSADKFESLLSAKTGLLYVRPCSLIKMNVKEIKVRIHNIRVLRSRYQIKKLPDKRHS